MTVRVPTTALVVLALACVTRSAAAHIVPVPPSRCAFEPLDLAVPATGIGGAADPAVSADMMRILYDLSESGIQVCPAVADPNQCGSPVTRGFTLGTTVGTLGFPAFLTGHILASGDVVMGGLPVTFTTGSGTATPLITFTTALVAVDGHVFEGAPLQGVGSITLVGVASGDALPPPLGGSALLVTMSCHPLPIPDKDQFQIAGRIAPIKGQVTTTKATLRGTLQASSDVTPDFAGHPTLLAVHADGVTVASASFANGLRGSRRLSATSDDGKSVIDVRPRRDGRFVFDVRFTASTLSQQAAGGRVLVDVVLDAGGTLARGEQLFHASRNGRKIHSGG